MTHESARSRGESRQPAPNDSLIQSWPILLAMVMPSGWQFHS